MTWYRMFDPDPGRDGCVEVRPEDAPHWNAEGYGIFWAVQDFDGPRRIDRCRRIVSFAIDLDSGTKQEQRDRLKRSPLIPSAIVETKNGYHAYWLAEDARIEMYRCVVSRMVEFFDADKNARDVARILRVPDFYHCKDPSNRFLVRTVYGPHRSRRYTERQIVAAFPNATTERREHIKQQRDYGTGDDLWEKIYNLDCQDGLERLSGTEYVGGEHFTFRQTRTGNLNIAADGKGTSCWIDKNKRIGSPSGGGPTLVQWLHWYGTPKGQCVDVVKQLYPEVCSD